MKEQMDFCSINFSCVSEMIQNETSTGKGLKPTQGCRMEAASTASQENAKISSSPLTPVEKV